MTAPDRHLLRDLGLESGGDGLELRESRREVFDDLAGNDVG